jgi:hypothetical protein
MKIHKTIALALCALFIAGCGMLGMSKSPTDALKGLHEASKKRDVEGIKKHLSKGTLKILDNAALAEKTTADELLKKDGGAPMAELPEIYGEKIEGDTAYVEIKNNITGEREKMPLVKEEGEWKIALDKYLEQMRERFTREMDKK